MKTKAEKLPDQLRVVAAAVEIYDGLVYTLAPPHRHHHIVRKMCATGLVRDESWEEGFLLSNGHFVGRHAAYIWALRAGQLISRPENGCTQKELYSEDVW